MTDGGLTLSSAVVWPTQGSFMLRVQSAQL